MIGIESTTSSGGSIQNDDAIVTESKGHLETARFFQQRQVKNALFSKSKPTPLKSPILVAYSSSALKEVMDVDIKPNNETELKTLLKFTNGEYFPNNSNPLSHNYGGHQVGILYYQ